jgi:hypothetical protein
VVADNDPGVQLTLLGSPQAFASTNDGLNFPAAELFSSDP